MRNSLTYLTRRCPRNCEYCALRDAKDIGKELSTNQWIEAFKILNSLGIDFNLILGNETWLLGMHLLEIMVYNKVPYALYTTCPEPIFGKYKRVFFDSGLIDNFSCGIDYPINSKDNLIDDSYHKSMAAWKGFKWIKRNYPDVDTQGTITIHKQNIEFAPRLVRDLSEIGVFVGINFIHWNKDGNYDFFPSKEEISNLLFTPKDDEMVKYYLGEILDSEENLLQNPEFISQSPAMLTNMGWHCKGDPYGGPTIDADGQLRCCGYRRGKYTPKYSIFDLPEHMEEWQEAVRLDAMECPGCAWSYPWMYRYWEGFDSDLGKKVFVKHAGSHIDESKWSKRKIE